MYYIFIVIIHNKKMNFYYQMKMYDILKIVKTPAPRGSRTLDPHRVKVVS